MKKFLISVYLLGLLNTAAAQYQARSVEHLPLEELSTFSRTHFMLKLGEDALGKPIEAPVVVLRGKKAKPVVGMIAAIHGNEVNGIQVLHSLLDSISAEDLEGTLIVVPGLNIPALQNHRRRFPDHEDLNRIFPGKATGNSSQQYVWNIHQKVLKPLDYLFDLHTASFGRENSLYVRADRSNRAMDQMARWQDADILLSSGGAPSAGSSGADALTMRAQAMSMGIPSITIEYGNPQVYQEEMRLRGFTGLMNSLKGLGLLKGKVKKTSKPVECSKSYWVYTDAGGFLEVIVGLKQVVEKDQLIAVLQDPFGQIKKEYRSPEAGIIIGRSSNPISESGGRIVHLGILKR